MAEKKKRWRPSLTAYRALEKELIEVKEDLRLQCRENKHRKEEIKELEKNLSDAVIGIYGKDIVKENKELKVRLEDQIEGTSRLVADCNEWRTKYQELLKDFEDYTPLTEYNKVLAKNESLDKNNTLIGNELERLRCILRKNEDKIADLQRDNMFLKNRGFWARVFNR